MALGVTITWKMVHNATDTELATMITAAKTGAAIAVKIANLAGTVLFDGDCTLAKKFNAPLAGESTYDFTATPTKSAARAATLG